MENLVAGLIILTLGLVTFFFRRLAAKIRIAIIEFIYTEKIARVMYVINTSVYNFLMLVFLVVGACFVVIGLFQLVT